MRNPLLDRSSPAELAKLGQVVEEQVELQSFTGLTEVLAADLSLLPGEQVPEDWRQTPVAIRLKFDWADRARLIPAVAGRVAARLPAVCQRCLGPMELSLDEELKLSLAGPDRVAAATGAMGGYDVWELDDATIRPLDILEETLIMALPLAALHGPGEGCDAPDEAASADRDETTRPFAGLRSAISGLDADDKSDPSD